MSYRFHTTCTFYCIFWTPFSTSSTAYLRFTSAQNWLLFFIWNASTFNSSTSVLMSQMLGETRETWVQGSDGCIEFYPLPSWIKFPSALVLSSERAKEDFILGAEKNEGFNISNSGCLHRSMPSIWQGDRDFQPRRGEEVVRLGEGLHGDGTQALQLPPPRG